MARTLDLIGDRWSMLILRDLRLGFTRFSDLLERAPGLSTKTLTERLRALEESGLVERRVYSVRPRRASYHLTNLGLSLEPVFEAFYDWGMKHAMPPGKRQFVGGRVNRMKGRRHAAKRSPRRSRA